jgi:predicted Zn finger-like uncharacterized protein
MKVSCQSCGATYAIADDKVSGRLVKVRCKSCHNPIVVDGRQAQPEARIATAAPARAQPAAAAVPAAQPEPTAELWSVNLSETDSRTMSAQEIVAAFHRGELAEAFVWKDGMGDWKPLLEVPELASQLGSQGGPSQPPAYDFGVKPHTSPGSTAYAEMAAEAAKPAAARVAGARGQSQDLFGAVDRAGSEDDAQHGHLGDADEHKLTGARNENSVLFSLDALKAGLVGQAGAKPAAAVARPAAPKPPSAAKPPGRPPAPSAPGVQPGRALERERRMDDVMNIGGGNALFSMGADQALLTAPAPPEPKPEPKPVRSASGGLAAPAMYVQAPPRRSFLMVALAGVFGLVGVGGAVAAVIMSQKTKADLAAQTDVSATAASVASAASVKTSEPRPSAAPAAPAESVAQAPADAGAQAAPAVPQRPLTEEEKKKYAETKKKAEEEKAKKTDEEKEKEKKAVESKVAAAGFDKNAAVSALTSAASAASACKRPDGPTGTGKVSVTFAPSGRATNAVISGGSFAGTSVGGCIASVFRRARVPAFSGDPVTVSKSFSISP